MKFSALENEKKLPSCASRTRPVLSCAFESACFTNVYSTHVANVFPGAQKSRKIFSFFSALSRKPSYIRTVRRRAYYKSYRSWEREFDTSDAERTVRVEIKHSLVCRSVYFTAKQSFHQERKSSANHFSFC